MQLLPKSGDHRSHRNGDINTCTNSSMATLQKTELNASIGHIAMFVKLGISIFDSEVSDTAGRKAGRRRRRRIHGNAITRKRCALHENAIRKPCHKS